MTTHAPISFAPGAPSLDIVAVDALKAAADRAFSNAAAGTTAYGTSRGYLPLRAWIAEYQQLAPEQVILTNGSMQADAFLFDLLVQPGDTVVVEAPSYDRTLLGLRNRGANIIAIPLQEDGIDVEALARALEAGARPKLAHIIPNFQNPAGYTLSIEKRRRLLELAKQYDFILFEDDPYVELRFEGSALPTMLSLDDADTVVYASSFSKTVCAGIRVGYLAVPEHVIAEIETMATNTYISPNMVAQSIANRFCRGGELERSIETVKSALHERRDALADALGSELPDAKFRPPEGGYFMWVELPEGTDVDALAGAAKEAGVVFVKGTDFLIEGGQNALRLAYSGVTTEQVKEGVSRLAAAYRQLSGAAV